MFLPMTRNAALLITLVLVGCSAQKSDTNEQERPNLLFIITDDQRYDMMGIVNPILDTPNMDQLAAEGIRFDNAFVTTPICAASRASLLTGLVERTHQSTFGTPPLAKRFADMSYPVLLRNDGYRTGMIGKFGVKTEPGAEEEMFNVFESFQAAPYIREQDDGSMRHLTDITADRAIEFLRAPDPSSPFALTLSFNAPHADDGDERQFIWPESMDEKYSDLVIPEPPLSDAAFFDALPEFLKDASLNRIRWYWRFDTADKAEAMTRGHYRMISGVDAAIGRVMAELESLGVADNTVIILMGDNGYFLGERGYAGKWLPYELSIRVPLVVFDPRTKNDVTGTIPSLPALNIDIAPTLLDLAGLDIPEDMQGRSMVPVLKGQAPPDWPQAQFYTYWGTPNHYGIRTDRYTYVKVAGHPVELFDREADPDQVHNVAGTAGYEEVCARLEVELHKQIELAEILPEQLPGSRGKAKRRSRE